MVMNVVCYAYACTCMPYDDNMPYVMFMREKLKEIRFGTYVFKLLEIKLMHAHPFL